MKCTQNGISIEKEEQNNDADPMNISIIEEKERREKERAQDLEILIERTTTDDGATDDGATVCLCALVCVSCTVLSC